jgi:hypothetical protein
MKHTGRWAVMAALLVVGLGGAAASEPPLPPVEDLPPRPGLPDPRIGLDGRRVGRAGWEARRKPELRRLFQHYMYGFMPPAPGNTRGTQVREDRRALQGTATLREVTLRFGPKNAPPIHLLLLLPNSRTGKVPVFLGLNFAGNHAVVDDPGVRIPDVWMYPRYPGVVANRATAAGRGGQKDVWNADLILSRGYGLATFYSGDVDPDRPDFDDGIHPHYRAPGAAPGPHEWGTIAAWAWGMSRCVDYLLTVPEVDGRRIAAVGHSRNGKATLVAAAFDERIALAIPHQAGCGGTAPSRGTVGESVTRINTSFPHWFCDEFPRFNDRPERLPFDQHALVALVAPRPILFSNAVEDTWANPLGQFEVLRAADPVYRMLGVEGLGSDSVPEVGRLLDSRLGYFIRPGPHSMNRQDWTAFLDFADRRL